MPYICVLISLVQGAFGEVYKVDYKGKTVAVKKLKSPEGISEDEKNKIYLKFRKEAEII
jgi:serine/threonine protein kinase